MNNQSTMEQEAAKIDFANILYLECDRVLKGLDNKPSHIYVVNNTNLIPVKFDTGYRGDMFINWNLVQEHDGDLENILDQIKENTPVAIFPSSQGVSDDFSQLLAGKPCDKEGYHEVNGRMLKLIERSCYEK